MSKVGKEKIDIGKIKGYKIEKSFFVVDGPLGTTQVHIPDFLIIKEEEGKILVIELKNPDTDVKAHFAMHGTTVRLVKNAVLGVTLGFKKTFLFKGLGYKFTLSGQKLVMNLGYSTPMSCVLPDNIKGVALKDRLEINSISKEALGNFKDKLIKIRPWNPYSGKGIIEDGDVPYTKAVVKTKK